MDATNFAATVHQMKKSLEKTNTALMLLRKDVDDLDTVRACFRHITALNAALSSLKPWQPTPEQAAPVEMVEVEDCEFLRKDLRDWWCVTHEVMMVGFRDEPVQCATGRLQHQIAKREG